jgi:hypothetical protein
VQPGGEGAIRPGGSDTSGLDSPSPDSGLQPPAGPPGRGSGHSGHASSGGS